MKTSVPDIAVLHFSETLVVSGCCRVMEHLAKGVDPARFRSVLYAVRGDADYIESLRAQGLEIQLIPHGFLLPIPPKSIAVLHRSGNASPFWDGLIVQLHAAGVRAIIERNIFGNTDPHSSRYLDRICANSLNTLWHHWQQSGTPEISAYLARHRVLYNAVSFTEDADTLLKLRTQFRHSYAIAEDAFVMGIVTRPDLAKIDALMLGLVPHLKKTIPNFVLITQHYPEALARPLRRMLGSRYHNLPVCSDAPALHATYAMMDVYGNFPSIGESFGMTIAEAMHAGKPVLALDMPQANKGNAQRELIEHGITGYLATAASEVADLVERLAANPDLCKKMGAAGRQKINRTPFAQEVVLSQFEAELRRCLGEVVTEPVLPDPVTIRHYLENYPIHHKPTPLAVVSKALTVQVEAARFGWKLLRRFL